MELMTDPVVDCKGHTYERSAIEEALMHRPGVSPFTNQRYPGGDAKLQPNYNLKSMIDDWVAHHGVQRPGSPPPPPAAPTPPSAASGSEHVGAPPAAARRA